MRIGQHGQLMHGVVEDHQRIRQHKGDRGHSQVIAGSGRQILEIAHDVVGHVTDRAADQTRQALQRDRVYGLKMPLDDMQRVLPFGNGKLGRLPVARDRKSTILSWTVMMPLGLTPMKE